MKKLTLLILLVASIFSACQPNGDAENKKMTIVCTTSIIADVVKNLVKDSVEVSALMGPGVDPHLYKATQGNIEDLTKASIVIYNGLHLEGKMGDIFEKLTKTKKVIAVSDFIPKDKLINSTDFQGAEDPHIWFDVTIWATAVNGLAEQLKTELPKCADFIEANRAAYIADLNELNNWVASEIDSIPEDQRVMITAHDAFKYFGKKYGIEVRGLQGISTTAEYGLRDITNLVDYIVSKKIKAIFVESSVPKKSIEAVIEGCREKGHDVKLGGELFSDALGAAGTPEGTYIGMFEHNVNVITEALK